MYQSISYANKKYGLGLQKMTKLWHYRNRFSITTDSASRRMDESCFRLE
jgi:hypothetical protein